MKITFGDNVRIKITPDTVALGVAGLVGQVFGETTPSVTGIKAIGNIRDDRAINVNLEGDSRELWFSTELLELIDHGPGTQVEIGGKKWVRSAKGDWEEQSDSPHS